MKAHVEKIGAQLVMTIEAEVHYEGRQLERMQSPNKPLVGEIKLNTSYRLPHLILRKEIL